MFESAGFITACGIINQHEQYESAAHTWPYKSAMNFEAITAEKGSFLPFRTFTLAFLWLIHEVRYYCPRIYYVRMPLKRAAAVALDGETEEMDGELARSLRAVHFCFFWPGLLLDRRSYKLAQRRGIIDHGELAAVGKLARPLRDAGQSYTSAAELISGPSNSHDFDLFPRPFNAPQ